MEQILVDKECNITRESLMGQKMFHLKINYLEKKESMIKNSMIM
jgi:hypothetical protein